MHNRQSFLKYFVIGAAGFASAAAGIWLSQRKGDQVLPLWDLTLPTPDGASLSLRSLKGGPLFLNFWAPWCPPCVEELPLLNQFYLHQRKKTGDTAKSFQMLGIAADKSASVVEFLKHHPIDFSMALAGFEGIALSKQLGNTSGGLPYSVWIDANGVVLATKQGSLTSDELQTLANRHLPGSSLLRARMLGLVI